MKYLTTLEALDSEIKRVDRCFRISDDAGRKALAEFAYQVDYPLPADPYSPDYRRAQMQLYLDISGRSHYTVANEHVPINVERAKKNPFPYCTRSAQTVGDQLLAIGYLIRTMGLPPGARVVEFGPGWGTTTLALSQMGYSVTAVDAEEDFLSLIAHRAAQLGLKVDVVKSDMLEYRSKDPYDAAIFFESFHHCSDHIEMLRNLHRLVHDDGLVAFAAEPIADAPYFPFPWGLRLEGMSVWSIRKFGWLELGFDTSYFLRTLLRLGWTPRRFHAEVSHYTDVVIARKSKRFYEPGAITLPPEDCGTWAQPEGDPNSPMRFAHTQSRIMCEHDATVSELELCLGNYAPFELKVNVAAGRTCLPLAIPASTATTICRVPVESWDGHINIGSETWRPCDALGTIDSRSLGVGVHSIRLL
jgi:SAM-dependent methyltransferase